jgi:hypothetical protein
LREPQEILEAIVLLDAESAEILAGIGRMLWGGVYFWIGWLRRWLRLPFDSLRARRSAS